MSIIQNNFYENRNINLRKEFEMLQNDYSLTILYIRASKYVRCSCYNPLHKVGDSECLCCLGSGFVNAIEKRKVIYSQFRFNNEGYEHSSLGDIKTDNIIINFDYKAVPKTGDLLFITNYSKNNLPISVDSVYEIQNPSPIRGDNGRIELYNTSCKLREDRLMIANKLIASLDLKAKKSIMKGKRYICSIK